MSQLVRRTALRALIVCGGGTCNMSVRSVSSVFVIKRPDEITKRMQIHDWCGGFGDFKIGSKHVQGNLSLKWRRMSSASTMEKKVENSTVKKDQNGGGSVAVPSYWGIETAKMKITRRDGSDWPWNSFMPWESSQADLSIDLKKHYVPKNIADKIAYRIVKLLRIPTDLFFQRRYGCRAMMLETVAAVPGMVGGMLLHLKSIRKFEHSGGWIKALLEEAENERMHLMTMMELVKPKWYERLLVILVQGVFFNSFLVCYVVSPRLAHRIVGYLEEEAIHSYTEFLKDIDDGKIENVAAPAIAIDYWRLPKDATLKDVVTVIRADEAHHRDVNHFASDIRNQGKELREAAAPIGYH
ncbi:PREDICTED: ubiquinol oxidase 2, mitochondrial isoform X2 [Camelina sativa]|uniref:Ubiquinol oxidase n=1 Tax=Camelina sativa TaxID=90675 RepID=A0ABM0VV32_CAMSA|nr:PREDICTED: ubiquinol oxidase 2, mitochondrial isoform X2 [Camelina sativa]